MNAKINLNELNSMSAQSFGESFGEVFEHAPWVAEQAALQRPFATVAALHDAMMGALNAAPAVAQRAFINGHPELASKVARAGLMTADSVAEQGSLGLDRLSDAEFTRFEALNAGYRARFGFPFIICVRRHTRGSILAEFERRLALDSDAEFAAALREIGFITRLRLVAKVEGAGAPKTEGRLSTHVLDTHVGKPAPGVRIRLFEVGASARGLLAETTTNSDGRTDQPLISGQPLRIGTYELEFAIGDYFRARGTPMAEPGFVDVVPLRFGIAEPEGHYHVPLLATPWSYSTYRGS
jgi:2-oxo-4-hydroxy-4-carboxy-5-ureidoimidazoline decarboxylase